MIFRGGRFRADRGRRRSALPDARIGRGRIEVSGICRIRPAQLNSGCAMHCGSRLRGFERARRASSNRECEPLVFGSRRHGQSRNRQAPPDRMSKRAIPRDAARVRATQDDDASRARYAWLRRQNKNSSPAPETSRNPVNGARARRASRSRAARRRTHRQSGRRQPRHVRGGRLGQHIFKRKYRPTLGISATKVHHGRRRSRSFGQRNRVVFSVSSVAFSGANFALFRRRRTRGAA